MSPTPVRVSDMFPSYEALDEQGETLSLLCATHAAQRRALIDPQWMGSYLAFADRYCGALMRSERHRELVQFSSRSLRFGRDAGNQAAFHSIQVMNVLGRHRLWQTLPHHVADDLVRACASFHPSVSGWAWGTAMAIYSENHLSSRVETCFSRTRPRPLDSDQSIAINIYINANCLSGVDKSQEALALIEHNWDHYLRLRVNRDAHELLPYLAAAKCHLAIGNRIEAESFLDEATVILADWDNPGQPRAAQSVRDRIGAIRSVLAR
ncbi:MAG: hypothetical protein P4L46_08235 [Fimbriimonas sp.]|nr:hypothetical protein [Fimbriimonas sp.]